MSKRRRDFRWVRWLLFLILIFGAVAIIILVKNNFDNKPESNNQQSVNTGESESKKSKEKADNDSNGKEKTSEQEAKAPQYEGESPNKSENLTGIITYANVIDNELVIRVNIDQFLQSGNCNLEMARNGVTYYSQSVGIIESVTTSTCDGFKIPVNELPSGDLQVKINLESEGKSGKIEGRVKI